MLSASDLEMTEDPETGCTLRISLVGSQAICLSVDIRTGKFVLKDAGVVAASDRDGRFRLQAAHLQKFPYDLLFLILQLKGQVGHAVERIFGELSVLMRYLSDRDLQGHPSGAVARPTRYDEDSDVSQRLVHVPCS